MLVFLGTLVYGLVAIYAALTFSGFKAFFLTRIYGFWGALAAFFGYLQLAQAKMSWNILGNPISVEPQLLMIPLMLNLLVQPDARLPKLIGCYCAFVFGQMAYFYWEKPF